MGRVSTFVFLDRRHYTGTDTGIGMRIRAHSRDHQRDHRTYIGQCQPLTGSQRGEIRERERGAEVRRAIRLPRGAERSACPLRAS